MKVYIVRHGETMENASNCLVGRINSSLTEEGIRQAKQVRDYFKDKNIEVITADFEKELFYETVKGTETLSEGGKRCSLCYRLRLEKTAEYAKKHGFDYFATTLSVSPLKDAKRINSIGEQLAKEYGVGYLYSDFKKRNGFTPLQFRKLF